MRLSVSIDQELLDKVNNAILATDLPLFGSADSTDRPTSSVIQALALAYLANKES